MNNKFFRLAARLMAVLLVVGATACSNNDEPDAPLKPTVKLTLVNAAAESATVNVESKNAKDCYIGYVVKGETEPTAEQVVTMNLKVASNGEYVIENLTPETSYVVIAVAQNGANLAESRLELTTTAVGAPNPEDAIKLDMLLEAVYRAESTVGNYQIVIANTRELAWNGDMQLYLDFYNELDADPINAVLPNGTYTATTTKEVFTFNPEYSYITIMRDGAPVQSPILGDIYVTREGADYTILVAGYVLLDEAEITISYTGPITFVEGASSEWSRFDSDQHADFEIGQGRYWGNWFYPFADDFGLEFFQGEFDENNTLVEGYYIQVSNIYMPKVAEYTSTAIDIAPGVYNIVSDNPLYTKSFAQPFTFDYGYTMDLFGSIINAGTYVTYVDRENNINQIGFIVDGTITIEGTASGYDIAFDLVTEEGVSITGSYSGALSLENWNDSDLNEIWMTRPWTTLTADHTYNWMPETSASAYKFGDYLKEGLDSWLVMIMAYNDANPNGYGDFFTTELLVPVSDGAEFPTGTFNITWDLDGNVMIPGYMDHAGVPIFTHYGDLTMDAEGYSAAQAAMASGTVVISKLDSGDYKFVFDMVDGNGNKVTGEWSGALYAEDLSDAITDSGDEGGHTHALAVRNSLAARR